MHPFGIFTTVLLTVFAPVAGADDDSLATLYERGQLRRASAVARKTLEARPNDPQALAILARIRALESKFDEATGLGERAVAAAPNRADTHFALAMVCGVRAQRASLIHKAGHGRRFKKEAEAALALDPNYTDAMQGLIQFHRQAPGIVGGDKKKAAELAERLMRVDPTEGWLQKAGIAFDEGDSAAGERCLRQAVDVAKKPEAQLALASYLIQPWRKPDEATRLARGVAEAEPWRAGAWSLLAAYQAFQEQYADLDATLASAESAVPANLAPHYQAARVLIVEGGDAARAEALLRRYLAAEPEIGAPSHAAAHWRLGLALEREGRKPEAIQELEKALKLDPKLESAKKDLQRLKK